MSCGASRSCVLGPPTGLTASGRLGLPLSLDPAGFDEVSLTLLVPSAFQLQVAPCAPAAAEHAPPGTGEGTLFLLEAGDWAGRAGQGRRAPTCRSESRFDNAGLM
jgi:hypothetical protein